MHWEKFVFSYSNKLINGGKKIRKAIKCEKEMFYARHTL